MKKIILIFTIFYITSCGKTKLDENSSSQLNSSAITCSQYSSCAKDCGASPSSSCMSNLSRGGSRQACIGVDDSSYDICMNKKIQIVGSSYYIINN